MDQKPAGANAKHRGLKLTGAFALAAVFLVVVGFTAWATIGVYQPDDDAIAAVRADDRVSLTEVDGSWVLSPTGESNGMGVVMLPGAKVDPLAYAPTFVDVAASGTTVVIPHLAFNLAFLDVRGVSDFAAVAPDAFHWAVAGHSLGGVRACMLANEATPLVLLGSYCATDLSGSDVAVLSLAGSKDGLSTPAKVSEARALLPSDAEMVVIDGANHTSFGAYGPQSGDGVATIPVAEVHADVAADIREFLGRIEWPRDTSWERQ
ncbi:alpha/beta hydrolase [Microbacterium gorillae]|uniref:alpha/beta hydrolase n=1 Tax=Microbacterium gorillae TaxID=1231063 RepID=UPI000A89866A|nr:alpha/beta hydrolase [Microbacterium gorillae]